MDELSRCTELEEFVPMAIYDLVPAEPNIKTVRFVGFDISNKPVFHHGSKYYTISGNGWKNKFRLKRRA